ncbi:MAG TPA: hypothetical protein VKU42_15690 [Candidatus Angelobacter sp.]|nr:hypothetical protein [Candidatus Angelobacter sp.]
MEAGSGSKRVVDIQPEPELIHGWQERYNRYIAPFSRLTYSWGLRTVALTLNLVCLGIGAALLVLQITPSFVHAQKRLTGIAARALVYGSHKSAHRREVNAQPDYQFSVYSFCFVPVNAVPPAACCCFVKHVGEGTR